jgi:hypothetical protein
VAAGCVDRALIILMVPLLVLPLCERDAVIDDEVWFSKGKVPDDGISRGGSDFFFRFFPDW